MTASSWHFRVVGVPRRSSGLRPCTFSRREKFWLRARDSNRIHGRVKSRKLWPEVIHSKRWGQAVVHEMAHVSGNQQLGAFAERCHAWSVVASPVCACEHRRTQVHARAGSTHSHLDEGRFWVVTLMLVSSTKRFGCTRVPIAPGFVPFGEMVRADRLQCAPLYGFG